MATLGQMLNVKQSSIKLGVSPSKMYELIAKRQLPHYRIDGKILVDEADLDSYLKSCRVDRDVKVASRSKKPFKHLNGPRLAAAWEKRGISPSP
jgi:excisionase family DNA binding protein